MKIIRLFFIIALLMFISCNHPNNNNSFGSGWKVVYKNDEKGKKISGSIDALISGIRNGYDVRIGWGWKKVVGDSILKIEHLATPLFLTVIQEQEVSIVIDAHPMLKSYIDLNNQKIGEGGHIWQCVLTTKGTFNAQIYNRFSGELIKDWPQRHTMTWFLEYPEQHKINYNPLFGIKN